MFILVRLVASGGPGIHRITTQAPLQEGEGSYRTTNNEGSSVGGAVQGVAAVGALSVNYE